MSSTINRLVVFLNSRWTFLSFVLIYAALFVGLRHGAGNNWDWLAPYFNSQSPALFTKAFSSWQPTGLGSPVGFAPGAYFLLLEGAVLKTGLPPEYMIYGLIVLIFALGSYIVFRTLTLKNSILAYIFALVAFINPAIFYKLLAGHLIYLIGYLFYVWLVCFLLGSYRHKVRDAATVGLLFALSALQVQFFVFSALTIVIYLVADYSKNRPTWKELAIIISIPILVHLFWLSSFIIGASSVTSLSEVAHANSFTALSYTSLKDIGLLIFSPATFIRYFYSKTEMVFFAVFWLLATYGLISKKLRLDRNQTFLIAGLATFTFLATGAFQKAHIPIIDTLYPLLREAGHSAPLVVLYLALSCFYLLSSNRRAVRLLAGYATVFILISLPVYFASIPKVNFAQARSQFSEFLPYVKDADPAYRILTYPFFNQYGFNDQPTEYNRDGTPMSNSGWDSFVSFSGKPYIENSTSPQELTSSIQYKFLQSYDVDLLSSYGIRYIYDFSGIYHTNVKAFIDPKIYNNESIDQADPAFFSHIEQRNPGKVKILSDHVLEITNAPSVVTGNVSSAQKISPERYQVTLEDTLSAPTVILMETYSSGWTVVNSSGQEVATSHYLVNNYANGWTIDRSKLTNNQVFIVYKGQTPYIVGWTISGLSLFGICYYLWLTRRRRLKSA